MRMKHFIAFSMLLILSGCFARSKPGSKLTGRPQANVNVQMSGAINDYPKVALNNANLDDYTIKGECLSPVTFEFNKTGGTRPIASDTCHTKLVSLKFKQPRTGTVVEFKRHDFTNSKWDENVGDVIRMKDTANTTTLFVKIVKVIDKPVKDPVTLEYFFQQILQGADHIREEQRVSVDQVTVEGVEAPLFQVRESYRYIDNGELRLKFDLECISPTAAATATAAVIRTVENAAVPNSKADLSNNMCRQNYLSNIRYVLVPDNNGGVLPSMADLEDFFSGHSQCLSATSLGNDVAETALRVAQQKAGNVQKALDIAKDLEVTPTDAALKTELTTAAGLVQTDAAALKAPADAAKLAADAAVAAVAAPAVPAPALLATQAAADAAATAAGAHKALADDLVAKAGAVVDPATAQAAVAAAKLTGRFVNQGASDASKKLWDELAVINVGAISTRSFCGPMKLMDKVEVTPRTAPRTYINKGGFSTFYIEVPGSDLRKRQRMFLILRSGGAPANVDKYSYSVYSVEIKP